MVCVCVCVVCPQFINRGKFVYAYTVHGMHIIVRTTPAERTKMSGILHVESSTTSDIRSTGGSTNLHKPHNYICISRRSHHTTVVSWRDRTIKGGMITDFDPRLLMMKVVTQNGTRSERIERTISIRCSSLQEFSHSPAHTKGRSMCVCLYVCVFACASVCCVCVGPTCVYVCMYLVVVCSRARQR